MSASTSSRLILLASLSLLLSACLTLPGHRQIIDEEGFYLKITAPNKAVKRNIRFNSEETGLTHLPEGARIELEVSDTLGERQLIITGSDTSITYKYRLNGRRAEFGAPEQEWFASQVPRIIDKSGLQSSPE